MGNDIYTGEFPWYRCDKAQSPWVVKGAWDLLSARWITKLDRYRRWLGIYKGKGLVGINLDQWAQYLDTDTINLNVTKSVIDALVSKISTNAPREVFLTDKGNWEKQRKAQNGTFIVDGIYHDQRAYQKARRAFFHACLWGTGFLQSYPCKLSSRVQNRVVPVTDLRWDEREARNDDLRSLFVRHVLPVGELLERFKVRYDDLKGSEREEQNRRSIDDRLVVYEAFHLPSAPGATDGLHVIQTSDVNLRWKPKWQVESKKPRFPLARFRYGNSAFGWEGEGVCENTEGIQDELTFIAQKIQRLFNAATVRGWVKEGSNVNPEGITNEEFVMGTYLGDTPPVFAPDIPVHPQYFQRIAELKQDAYELNGLSEMFARGRVPSNLQSAVAIQEARDEQGERYQETNEDFEEFHRDIAENDIQAARELAEDGPYEIWSPDKQATTRATWKDFDLGEDDYVTKTWPTSLLPKTPAGRLERVGQLLQIVPAMAPLAADLLDFPDVDQAMSLISAPVRAIRADLERLSQGEHVDPEPFIDLKLALNMALDAYLRARNGGAPESVLECFREYMVDVKNMIAESQKAPPNPTAVMGLQGAPAGLPGSGISTLPPGGPAGGLMPMPQNAGSPLIPPPPMVQAMMGGAPMPGGGAPNAV